MTRQQLDTIKAAITVKKNLINTMQESITQNAATMRTIANGFSDTIWKILPQSIKAYFNEYRNEE